MEQALNLPEDPEDLRRLVLALTQENRQLKAQQDTLQEYIRLLLHKRFEKPTGAGNPTCSTKQNPLPRTTVILKV